MSYDWRIGRLIRVSDDPPDPLGTLLGATDDEYVIQLADGSTVTNRIDAHDWLIEFDGRWQPHKAELIDGKWWLPQ
jgi:hypothetical protein